jgi:predicted ATPase
MAEPRLFVISGGPGSGKTTLLSQLAARGFRCAPEVARQIIQEQVRMDGRALPWKDREAYTEMMLQRSIESFTEHGSVPGLVFFDRGIPDTLGYARLIGLRDESAIREACRRYRYAKRVFLAPPWEAIYRTDDERKQDFAEAEHTHRLITEVYLECGYEVVELPKAAPAARAQFILQGLDSDVAVE